MCANGLWYGVVREFEVISYQFTPAFFTSYEPSKTAETRMYYTMCWRLALLSCLIFSISGCQGCIKPNVKLSIKKPVLLEISNQKVVCQVMQIVFFVVLKCKQLVKYLSY